MPTIRAETTPNPNSLKFTTDEGAFLEDGVESFSSAGEAKDNLLARRLFSVPGVKDVFVTPQFVTVSKTPNADWSNMKSDVEAALTEYLDGS